MLVDDDTDDATHRRPRAPLLDTQLAGARLDVAARAARRSPAPTADTLAREARDALRSPAPSSTIVEPLYVGGASRLAAEQEAFPTRRARPACSSCSNSTSWSVSLLRELLDPGLTVRIGSENPIDDLRDCSLVLAPYLVEGEVAGTVGVLGPTRMDYRKAQAAVAAVSQQLGRRPRDR